MPNEGTISPGLYNAITKGGLRSLCACGFPLPRYPGRYPSKCPNCGNPIAGRSEPEPPADAVIAASVPDEQE